MRETYLEMVEWRKQEIEHTAFKIISFYAQTLPFLGTSRWVRFASEKVLPNIRGETAKPVELVADGFHLVFRGPVPDAKSVILDGQPVFLTTEPRFTFFDNTRYHLSPKLRTWLYRTNEAIGEEATDVYKLIVLRDPFTYIFPKTEYAQNINYCKAFFIN